MRVAEVYRICWKKIYNAELGWGLPARETCMPVVEFWQQHPRCAVVDFGAGSGLFCRVFHYLGIPPDKLFAVDFAVPLCGTYNNRQLWPRSEDFVVNPRHILFIAWGLGCAGFVRQYVASGGWCVIILGEPAWGGCTYPVDTFRDEPAWTVNFQHVKGAASLSMEFLSINVRV